MVAGVTGATLTMTVGRGLPWASTTRTGKACTDTAKAEKSANESNERIAFMAFSKNQDLAG